MRPIGLAFTLVATFTLLVSAVAQEPPAAAPAQAAEPDAPVTPKSLRDDQLSVSGRYARFERMLTQMADILGLHWGYPVIVKSAPTPPVADKRNQPD